MNTKIKTIEELNKIVTSLKLDGKKLVTTNGSFDILHIAHLRLLEKAKSMGDVLFVLINDDASIKNFKGYKRPITPQNERALHLSYLMHVDYVVIFSEDNPLNLLKIIKPNIHVKGGSVILERIKEEKELVESWGGKFTNFELEENYSTTDIIKKISQIYNPYNVGGDCPKSMFNRNLLKVSPLSERISKSDISVMWNPSFGIPEIDEKTKSKIEELVVKIKQARKNNKPVVIAYGAHLIKNGLSLVIIELMKKGYVQHLMTNGAGTIHDWEFAYQGKTEEDVKRYISQGQFGIWHETGYYINEAIKLGALDNIGYGAALGQLINEENLNGIIVSHKFKDYSILGNAFKLKIPISVCPSIGHDIIHTHPAFDGAALGRAADIDFLKFVKTLTNLEGGVFISIGSAIAAPMVFEKAISMAKNLALQNNERLDDYYIAVNDIQPGDWDWSKGEPPKDNPAYYLRFFKTFSRVGGKSEYIRLDNKLFLQHLYKELMSN